MKNFLKISSKLQWLWLIGVFGDLTNISGLEPFYFFGLFALIEVLSNLRSIPDNLHLLFQMLGQLFCIPLTHIRYGFSLPSAENYHSDCKYTLPFEGEWYVVNGGTEKETSHSWAVCSQRYAYDFYIQDEQGQSYCGDREDLSNYYCYKRNVLSPADGIVVAAKDFYIDTPIAPIGTADCAAGDIRGNFIVIRHGDRQYSVIAHLLRGSISVKPGDKVARGQKIACCGNSGNTSEPHIHFQVQAGRSFLLSAGLPILFNHIEIDNEQSKSPGFITNGQHVKNI